MIENKFQLQWNIPFQKFDSKMNENELFAATCFSSIKEKESYVLDIMRYSHHFY